MKITIAGLPGSGKSTVSEILKEKLGDKYIIQDVGLLRRKFAKDSGMTLEEFNKWSEDNPKEGDKFFDEQTGKFGEEHNDFIMVARLGFYFIPDSIKLFISCDDKIAAERIFNQKSKKNERNELETLSVEEQIKNIKERKESDSKRYMKLYGIDPYDKTNFDIVIDTSHITQEEAANLIFKKLNK